MVQTFGRTTGHWFSGVPREDGPSNASSPTRWSPPTWPIEILQAPVCDVCQACIRWSRMAWCFGESDSTVRDNFDQVHQPSQGPTTLPRDCSIGSLGNHKNPSGYDTNPSQDASWRCLYPQVLCYPLRRQHHRDWRWGHSQHRVSQAEVCTTCANWSLCFRYGWGGWCRQADVGRCEPWCPHSRPSDRCSLSWTTS